MENSYGIGVANRYALFLDEAEDPYEVLKAKEQEREAKKKTKLSEKENKGKTENKGKASQVVRKGIKETQNVKTLETGKSREDNNRTKTVPRPVPDRGERNVKFAGESREERNNRRNREDRPFLGAGEFSRDGRENRADGEFRGRGRGGIGGGGRGIGRGRGMRGGGRGGYDNRGKREFDRQSGSDKTGVKPVDKRDGAGAHNWGTHKDEFEEHIHPTRLNEEGEWAEKVEETAHPSDITEPNTPVNRENEGAGDGEENAQPIETEPRELTLDEYYAMRGSRQKPTYNIRKAGEGEDLTQWKKMYELKKKDGEEEEEEEEEYDASEYPQRVGRQKHLLDIDIHFADSRRGSRGRGRGGIRGVGRGGRGSSAVAAGGMPRGPAEPRGFGDRVDRDSYQRGRQQCAPKVDDEHDFPSLG